MAAPSGPTYSEAMSDSQATTKDYPHRIYIGGGTPTLVPDSVASVLARVRERIAGVAKRSGRDPDSVTLVAVSKVHPADAIREAAGADAGSALSGNFTVTNLGTGNGSKPVSRESRLGDAARPADTPTSRPQPQPQ